LENNTRAEVSEGDHWTRKTRHLRTPSSTLKCSTFCRSRLEPLVAQQEDELLARSTSPFTDGRGLCTLLPLPSPLVLFHCACYTLCLPIDS
jgi:hypothetical protein